MFWILVGIGVLGVMVLLHEWGHFLAAKLLRVRVLVFSIGFGPRLLGMKRGATDYRLSALPLGGYVRMAGDNPAEERAGAADEFLSQPRGHRALIVLAGPVTLAYDGERQDVYGRWLVLVRTEDGTLLNRDLLEQGLARVYERSDFALKQDFTATEAAARAAKKGIWAQP